MMRVRYKGKEVNSALLSILELSQMFFFMRLDMQYFDEGSYLASIPPSTTFGEWAL